MKKLTLLTLSLLLCLSINAQVCQPIQCNVEQQFSGGISNTSFNGNVCIKGIPAAVWTNSANINGWTYITLKGELTINQSLNFPSGAGKIYIDHNTKVKFNNNLTMNGGDTIFLKSNAIVEMQMPNSNNSYTNVIVRGSNSSLKIDNVFYNGTINDTLRNNPINPTNIIVIISCNDLALPIDTTNHSVKPPIVAHVNEWWNSNITIYSIDGRIIYSGLYNPKILPKNQVLIVKYTPYEALTEIHKLILQ